MIEEKRYAQPYFRLIKCAHVVNELARHGQRERYELLDVGCGPATLGRLLDQNIDYYGIDIAVARPAPNLLELNVAEQEIAFGDRRFDFVVAAGIFEYVDGTQDAKLAEIRKILKPGGKFITTYTNFQHTHLVHFNAYNNIESLKAFKASLTRHFWIDHWFAISHNWHGTEPHFRLSSALQMRVNVKIPVISSLFAVNYMFVCSHLNV